MGKGIYFFAAHPSLWTGPVHLDGRGKLGRKTPVLKLRVKEGRASLAPSPAQEEHQIVEEMTGGSEQKKPPLEEGDI